MTIPTFLYPAARSTVAAGGQPEVAIYGPVIGGLIMNPGTAGDQGVPTVEELYIDLIGPASLGISLTTYALEPGQLFVIPANFAGNISVNAATSGHRFSAYVIQNANSYTPPTGNFPPDGPTGVLRTILSYLYEEYRDDDDLQAFVDGFNGMAQDLIDWFVNINLPVYTSDTINGELLDWVAEGLYGLQRPALPSGLNHNIGPLNTYPPNPFNPLVPLNTIILASSQQVYFTNDDVFKRILTWHFFKGDGKVFTIRWLKRRIMRFLIGINGTAPNIDQTYVISVTFGLNYQVNINVGSGIRKITKSAMLNTFQSNTIKPNELDTSFTPLPQLPLAPILKAGIDTGILELPFQFTYVVTIH
jgi:hypothetical protein